MGDDLLPGLYVFGNLSFFTKQAPKRPQIIQGTATPGKIALQFLQVVRNNAKSLDPAL
jgi:hypothetical protein